MQRKYRTPTRAARLALIEAAVDRARDARDREARRRAEDVLDIHELRALALPRS